MVSERTEKRRRIAKRPAWRRGLIPEAATRGDDSRCTNRIGTGPGITSGSKAARQRGRCELVQLIRREKKNKRKCDQSINQSITLRSDNIQAPSLGWRSSHI